MIRQITLVCAATGLFALLAFGPSALRSGPSPAPPHLDAVLTDFAPDAEAALQQRGGRGGMAGGGVYKSQITAHWFHNNARFWYRNDLRGGTKEFILVDAEAGKRGPAFDHAKLATSLSKASGAEHKADKLPFTDIAFVDNEKAIQFKVGETNWKCDLSSYGCSKTTDPMPEQTATPTRDLQPLPEEIEDFRQFEPPWVATPDDEEVVPQQRGQGKGKAGQAKGKAPQGRGGRGGQAQPQAPRPSPDGKWTASVKDFNIVVREGTDGPEVQLSTDGKEGLAYGSLQWAPDSKTLVAFRIEPGDRKEVYRLQSSPPDLDPIRGGRAILQTSAYALPGDKFTAYELNLFDVTSKKQTKPEVDRIDFGNPNLRWKGDKHTFTYQKVDRGHQRFRIVEVDSHTGKTRNIIDEQTKTFIWTAHAENGMAPIVRYLDDTDEIIWASEKDGWRHLYLVDGKEGKVKNAITKGDYCVRGVDANRIDVQKRQILFRAGGKNPGQDPYFVHFYRVNFDGTGLVALTEGDGSHSLAYSPDEKYIIDTYSRVNMAPVHELRRVSDGKLVCPLESADVSEMKERGWEPPEVFVAKGRDGKTDIWGIIVRPRNFDPNKKYPIIEDIYAGPQGGGTGGFVPKTFSAAPRYGNYTNMGFIVVKVDGMGLPGRSKAFHDVCWHDLKDAGFPDRILWHKAIAAKYTSYDISRVGITGTSAGGQNSTGGVLFHPDFYKVAVSGCGCHDNRMDKASWNEQWMGYPVGPQYAASSNVDNAYRLQGHLMLIVGELDTNVPPESTFRVADALIKANKDFELVVVPGAGHGIGGAYGSRKRDDFFAKHLLGTDAPNRNTTPARGRGRGNP